MKKYKVGFVLSGGGTRGFAHLGAIAALFERGIKPDVISGTSVGAIAGAFIAAGKTAEETMEIFKKGWFFKYTRLSIPLKGLFRLSGLEEVFKKEIKFKNIEDLPVPFFIGVSNLNQGTVEYHNTGLLCRNIIASSSIPMLFAPVEMDGESFVDGGLMDNIPIEPIKNDCKDIVVINISPLSYWDSINNLTQIALRSFYMSVNANVPRVKKHSSLFIEPEGIEEYEILSWSHAKELYDLGYKAVKDAEIPF
jgi:NTE family protein